MPLYKTITVDTGIKVYIWQVSESEEQLSEGITLTEASVDRIGMMKSEMHRRAFLSIRHLLMEAGYSDQDLYYNDNGKPHLTDDTYVSISHSHNYTGLIVGKGREVGIDIEKQRDKILRIAHKFTPIHEYRTIANTEALIRKLTFVWGAKESLYKIYATQGLSFLHHITIKDFSMTEAQTEGEILYKGKSSYYDISFLEFDGFGCVYALKAESG